jgi:hypothetical protein
MLAVGRIVHVSGEQLRLTGLYGRGRWWIRAWRLFGCTRMHRIRRGARIYHNNRSHLSAFAAGVASVTNVVLRRSALRDRQLTSGSG